MSSRPSRFQSTSSNARAGLHELEPATHVGETAAAVAAQRREAGEMRRQDEIDLPVTVEVGGFRVAVVERQRRILRGAPLPPGTAPVAEKNVWHGPTGTGRAVHEVDRAVTVDVGEREAVAPLPLRRQARPERRELHAVAATHLDRIAREHLLPIRRRRRRRGHRHDLRHVVELVVPGRLVLTDEVERDSPVGPHVRGIQTRRLLLRDRAHDVVASPIVAQRRGRAGLFARRRLGSALRGAPDRHDHADASHDGRNRPPFSRTHPPPPGARAVRAHARCVDPTRRHDTRPRAENPGVSRAPSAHQRGDASYSASTRSASPA